MFEHKFLDLILGFNVIILALFLSGCSNNHHEKVSYNNLRNKRIEKIYKIPKNKIPKNAHIEAVVPYHKGAIYHNGMLYKKQRHHNLTIIPMKPHNSTSDNDSDDDTTSHTTSQDDDTTPHESSPNDSTTDDTPSISHESVE